MSLKVFIITTFFAFFAGFKYIRDYFSDSIRTFCCAVLPVWVGGTTHIFSANYSHTLYRTIFPRTAPTFTDGERNAALIAGLGQQCFWFIWSYLCGACSRACLRLAANVGVRTYKVLPTNWAYKSSMSSTFYFS